MSLRTLLFCAATAAGCQAPIASHVKHDADNPVVNGAGPLWAQSTDEEYFKISQGLRTPAFDDRLLAASALPADHPLRLRLQGWADRLDQALRRRYPGQLDHIPSPKLRILQSEEMNAYVTWLPVCFDNVVVRMGSDVAPVAGHAASYFWGVIGEPKAPDGTLLCRHSQATAADVLAHVNNVNNTDRRCKLAFTRSSETTFEIQPGAGCLVDPDLAKLGAVAAFAALPTSDNITFLTGLLRGFNEGESVAALYHELGHYYRGHLTGPAGRYDYLYHLAGHNPATAPLEADDLAAANAALHQAQRASQNLRLQVAAARQQVPRRIFAPVAPEQQYHTAMFKPVWSLVARFAKAQSCAASDSLCQACGKVQAPFTALGRLANTTEGLTGPLTADEQKSYLEFETAATACLSPVTIIDRALAAGEARARTTIVAADAYAAFQNEAFGLTAPYLKEVKPSGNLVAYLRQASALLTATYPALNSDDLRVLPLFKDAWQKLNGHADAAAIKLLGFDDLAASEQLGYFSVEQEADDLAVEWLALAGLDPHLSVDMDISLIRVVSGDQAVASQCAALRQAKWLGSDGQPIILPWGPLADPHPTGCFRPRNSFMEIAAHGYKTPASSLLSTLRPSWEELLAAVGGPLAIAKLGGSTTPAFGGLACRFAPP